MATSIMAGFASYVKADAALIAIQSTRYYNGTLPQGVTYPCSVGTLISDIALDHTHDEKTGPRQARIQVDAYAQTVDAVENLIETYFDELAGKALTMGTFNVAVFDEGRNPDRDFQDEKTLANVKGRSRDFLLVY